MNADDSNVPSWRKPMPDLHTRLTTTVVLLSELGYADAADVVRRAAHLLNSAESNIRKEEREAWDAFASAAFACHRDIGPDEAAKAADALLVKRRERFARKEEA